MELYLTEILIFGLGFVLIALASKDVGNWFTKIKLPKITGFLFTGIVAGPFVLGLISSEAVERLVFVDEIALAFIAFAAGNALAQGTGKAATRSSSLDVTDSVPSVFSSSNKVCFVTQRLAFAKLASRNSRLHATRDNACIAP